MPKGIIIMEWDERGGGNVVSKFPQEIELSDTTFMQIYANHDSEEGMGVISMMIGPLNVVSYYTGEETGYYIILLLDLDEEGEQYEDALIDAGNVIIEAIEQDTIDIILSGIFHRISLYPKLEPEQLLALLYTSKVKRNMLFRLEREGSINKGELSIWLKEITESPFIDVDAEIVRLAKYDLIKQVTIKGFPTEVIFLMNVLLITRVPPRTILKEAVQRGMPEKILPKYKDDVVAFFKEYIPVPDDSLECAEVITEPACYEILKLLRTSVVTIESLEKLKKRGVEDIKATLDRMIKSDIVIELEVESGTKYYALKSDIRVQKIFPEYIINTVRQSHKDRIKSPIVLIEHLKLLKRSYLEVASGKS
ncbi:MAG: hypothetical protein ACTSXU_03095 [Promethearchaeota archaeon]